MNERAENGFAINRLQFSFDKSPPNAINETSSVRFLNVTLTGVPRETMRSESAGCTIFSLNTPCTLQPVVSVRRRDVGNTIRGIAYIVADFDALKTELKTCASCTRLMPNLGSIVDIDLGALRD